MKTCSYCHSSIPADSRFCPYCDTVFEDAPVLDEFEYEAFISYRHVARDRALAAKIQKFVEAFAIPKALQQEVGGKKRLGKCFRDEDELPTSSSLPNMIEDALKKSKHLIVICSPEMRESQWVQKEVETFARFHGRNKIIIALAANEPNEAFPELLLTKLKADANGSIHPEDVEPLAADFRESEGKKFDAEATRIIASILGCNYDDLRQRLRARKMQRIAIGSAAAAVVSLTFGVVAFTQQLQIERNYIDSLRNQSEYLATETNTLLTQGDRMQAVQVALAALGEDSASDPKHPYTTSARLALEEACMVYPDSIGWQSDFSQTENSSVKEMAVSPDGSMYATSSYLSGINIYDTLTGSVLTSIKPTLDETEAGWDYNSLTFFENLLIYIDRDKEVVAFDVQNNTEIYRIAFENALDEIAISPESGQAIAVSNGCVWTTLNTIEPGKAVIFDARTGTISHSLNLEVTDYILSDFAAKPAAISPNGDIAAACSNQHICLIDTKTGALRTLPFDTGIITSFALSNDTLVVATADVPIVEGMLAWEVEAEEVSYSIKAYDLETLQQTWATNGMVRPVYYFETGNANALACRVCTPRFEELTLVNGEPCVIAAIDEQILIYNESNGSLVDSFLAETPIAGAHVFDVNGTSMLSYATATGIVSNPRSLPASAGTYGEVNNKRSNQRIDTAQYFVDPNGMRCCLLEGSETSTYLYRFHQITKTPNISILDHTEDAGEIYNYLRSCNGNYYINASVLSFEDFSVFDGSTFEVVCKMSQSEIADNFELRDAVFSEEFDNVLYLIGVQENSTNTVFAMDVSTGEVLGSKQNLGTPCLITTANLQPGTVAYVGGTSIQPEIVIADAQTFETIKSTPLKLNDTQNPISYTGQTALANNLLLVETRNNTVTAFDMTTGEQIQTDLSELTLQSADEGCPAFTLSEENSCGYSVFTDGMLRCYDFNGNVKWKTAVDVRNGFYVTPLNDDLVFIRESSGQVSLLDSQTGERITASTNSNLEDIKQSWVSSNGEKLYVIANNTGEDSVLITININPESFGIESYVSCGVGVSANEKLVLCRYSYDLLFTLPLYSTEELVEYARELIKGNELTVDERRLYHIE